MLARLFCPGYSSQGTPHPATCQLGAQATLPRLMNTLPTACLFAGQATLPRLMHTLQPGCLPVCWPGYSAQQILPSECLPACVLARLFCPGYSTQATANSATCMPACLLARLLCTCYCTPCHMPAFLPVSCQGYYSQATEHPASCLPVCLLARLLCPGYSTPSRLPAFPFAGKANLPSKPCRMTACLPACWPG